MFHKCPRILAVILLAASATMLLSACAHRQKKVEEVHKTSRWVPAEHPYYLSAMSDLRMARSLLDQPASRAVREHENRAIAAIDAALYEMKQAAIEDGKKPWKPVPVDTRLSASDRFHKALELLDQARRDVDHREDDPWVRDLQGRILHNIDDAYKNTQYGIRDALR